MNKYLGLGLAAIAVALASCTDLPIHDAVDPGPVPDPSTESKGEEPKGMAFVIAGADLSMHTLTCQWLADAESQPQTKTMAWKQNGRVVFDIATGVVKSLTISKTGTDDVTFPIGRAPGYDVALEIDSDFALAWRLTADHRRLVGTAAELIKMRGATELAGNYIQEADINLAGQTGWLPIGDGNTAFSGIYDGGLCKIRNLDISSKTSDNLGLFGCNSGTLKNIVLESAFVDGHDCVGCICGYNDGLIQYCTTDSSSGVHNDNDNVGGICGCSDGSISGCQNAAMVSGAYKVGGICGAGSGVVNDCINSGRVEALMFVGGIVGWSSNCSILDCFNMGPVCGSEYMVGGICGKSSGGVLDGCTNNGRVEGAIEVGGVVGYNAATVVQCSNENGSEVTGRDDVGGICGKSLNDVTRCVNYASITGNGNRVGGVCGSQSGNTTTCTNRGQVTGVYFTAGVCGRNEGIVSECHNFGQIAGGEVTGGICGETFYGAISGCTNNGGISASSAVVGGICACNTEGNIDSCSNTGNVTGYDMAGGVCGIQQTGSGDRSSDNGATTCCSNSGRIVGHVAGGICGTNFGQILACYNQGDVAAVEVGAGICPDNSGTVQACYCYPGFNVSGQITYDICRGFYGDVRYCYYNSSSTAQYIYDGTTYNCQYFSADNWPSDDNVNGWGATSSNDNYYWKSLGGWNGGSPVYPKLWWEE